MAESTPRFEGEVVNLGGDEYVVPALSLRQVQKYAPFLNKLESEITGMPEAAQMDEIVNVMLAALSRNYPEMTKEQLLDLVDLGNMRSVLKAVMRISGLVPRDTSGKAEPGAASP
jgi:hypothetical protein